MDIINIYHLVRKPSYGFWVLEIVVFLLFLPISTIINISSKINNFIYDYILENPHYAMTIILSSNIFLWLLIWYCAFYTITIMMIFYNMYQIKYKN